MIATTLLLFGLNISPLYKAIAQVESDSGKTSDNVYQIRQIYVNDVNRLFYADEYSYRDVTDERKSERMMYLYWKYYGAEYSRRTHKPVTYEVLARIHNGGPKGYAKRSTLKYWKRVKRQLEKQGKK